MTHRYSFNTKFYNAMCGINVRRYSICVTMDTFNKNKGNRKKGKKTMFTNTSYLLCKFAYVYLPSVYCLKLMMLAQVHDENIIIRDTTTTPEWKMLLSKWICT